MKKLEIVQNQPNDNTSKIENIKASIDGNEAEVRKSDIPGHLLVVLKKKPVGKITRVDFQVNEPDTLHSDQQVSQLAYLVFEPDKTIISVVVCHFLSSVSCLEYTGSRR